MTTFYCFPLPVDGNDSCDGCSIFDTCKTLNPKTHKWELTNPGSEGGKGTVSDKKYWWEEPHEHPDEEPFDENFAEEIAEDLYNERLDEER